MAAILRRIPRTRQPAMQTGVDPYWRARGILYAATYNSATGGPGGTVKNVVGGADAFNRDNNNPFALETTQHGIALASDMGSATAGSILGAGEDFSVGLTAFTLVTWFVFNPAAPSKQWLTFRKTNIMTLDVFSQTSTSLNWGSDWSGSWNGQSQQTLGNLSAGQLVCIAASISAGGGRLFHNGRLAGTKPGISFAAIPAGGVLNLIMSSAQPRGSIKMLGQAAFSRALADGEMTRITANPWQIFEPQRTKTFIAMGGGGVVPTVDGSIAGIGAITYSGTGAIYGVLPNNVVVSARNGVVFSGLSAVSAEVIPIVEADVAANASNTYSGLTSSSITLAPKVDIELKPAGGITHQGLGSVEVNLASPVALNINATDVIKYSGYSSVKTSTAESVSCLVQSSGNVIYIGNSSVNISTDDSISVTTNGQGSIAYKALGNVDTSTTPVVSLVIDANDSIAYRSTGSIAGVLTTLVDVNVASGVAYNARGDVQTTVGQNAVDVISEAQGRLFYSGSAYADVVLPSIVSVISQGSVLYGGITSIDIAAISTTEVGINSNGAFSYKARSTIYVDKDMTTPDTKYLSVVRLGNYLSTSNINTYVSKA